MGTSWTLLTHVLSIHKAHAAGMAASVSIWAQEAALHAVPLQVCACSQTHPRQGSNILPAFRKGVCRLPLVTSRTSRVSSEMHRAHAGWFCFSLEPPRHWCPLWIPAGLYSLLVFEWQHQPGFTSGHFQWYLVAMVLWSKSFWTIEFKVLTDCSHRLLKGRRLAIGTSQGWVCVHRMPLIHVPSFQGPTESSAV